uniref:Ubiquitin-conjugating enzyme E2 J2 n=1 Tax=Tetraselmis sp. GSL018 TaxID=582737 RepID=A0A061SA00_9CHLO|mmetsp:Transcript_8339/g.19998  ORF Transcript_8339/g.19998 Transcript_8339/m.19998 type:complete len:230 (-) Transcript_8339:1591-2280(-)
MQLPNMGDRHVPKETIRRLQKEYKSFLKDPPTNIFAHPSPNNILEWHYVILGSDEFDGGVYHGKLVFPPAYPYKPPSIKMLTPNGRFAIDTRLCLSMSDFHPETWNPMWSVASILTGLLSFMHDRQQTNGSIETTKEQKRRFARESLGYNLKNPMFRKLFPEWEGKLEEHEASFARQAKGPGGGESSLPGQGRGSCGHAALSSSYLTAAAAAVCVAAVLALPLLSLSSG